MGSLRKLLSSRSRGIGNQWIKVNGKRINCTGFADEIVLLADSEKCINRMLQVVSYTTQLWTLQVNKWEMKVMVVRKHIEEIRTDIKMEDVRIDQVKYILYLGSIITDVNRCLKEVKRIALRKHIFKTRKNCLTTKHMKIGVCKIIRMDYAVVWL